ncbi:aldehyde reductase [Ancylobacter sp. TS-1]|uniref:SDR family oxidoreductase n=1 Tax=Ancylobacter sp. TS-1 TaxID=1850374 RepID=UPI001265C136|nr:aldehyde reductase [Ancylobacter sp. TS-1]QFR33701.1 NAD-dependent epimerase/dehydratase family protein [Ancylobacter sp. TS-1]
MASVLVTGGSGFIATHVIARLLAEGHAVRASLRNPAREGELRAALGVLGADPGERLDFAVADLLDDAGWAQAMAGVEFVQHVASPFPAGVPGDADELIRPAREGTLRVLRAAREAGAKRVVVTSSFAAVGYGHTVRKPRYDETDWTDPAGADAQPYMVSKTLAERAAWDFIAREGGGMELVAVNPVGVFGPVAGPDLSTSTRLVKAMLEGAIPACPRIFFGVVDVRDVADLHLRAMTAPQAAGERFLATAGDCVSLIEVARTLRARLGPAARRVPRFQMPDAMVRLAAPFVPMARAAVPQLGLVRNASGEKAEHLLGWTPRPADEAIAATGESLIRLGLVKA